MRLNIASSSSSKGSTRLPISDYTIGWIATLPHERAVAEAMLDQVHMPPPSQPGTNDEIYTLGSIRCEDGVQNVVIVTLPSGLYGTASAARAAAHMLSTFPNIKLGLMVGVGGGIPNRVNDIRLGDVVVSQPNSRYGGVRQYNFGKATPQGFEEGALLTKPPRLLLNAVNVLRARHELHGSKILEILQAMDRAEPSTAKSRHGPGYVHPGRHNDRLFHAGYQHVGKTTNCDECSTTEIVPRESRRYLDPDIHHGIIASGNAIVKDAQVRDSLGEGCLCFETEAAGLMNDFPCLVIRGISDYCDSHRNDQWQRYAAATAAAYAKELLQILPSKAVK